MIIRSNYPLAVLAAIAAIVFIAPRAIRQPPSAAIGRFIKYRAARYPSTIQCGHRPLY